MDVAIIAIGDELLLGSVTDTNTPFIAATIDRLGGRVVYSCHVADDPSEIYSAIGLAMSKADLVLTTGGLGPTKDDITKEVMCRYFGGRMRHDDAVARHIEDIFRRKGLPMNDLTASQAMVPDCCTVVENAVGTAPVMWFERDGKVLVSMPGVPREMRYVFDHEVVPRLRGYYDISSVELHHRFISTEGISESDVNTRIEAFEVSSPLRSVHIAYLPQTGYLKLRMDAEDAVLLSEAESLFCKEFEEYVIFKGDITPAEALLNRLREAGLTVSSAESCTGGNIAHQLTLIAGCSDVYQGSVVSYSNEVKMHLLGVNASTLDSYGAVSVEVAREMAEGVALAVGTDCSMATSGIAGPGGATPGKPVGTVCIAVKFPSGTVSDVYHFTGGRSEVISRATVKAITLLIRGLGCRATGLS
ncbi:MAG: CinA family nicotinamide mononucleotide deamidase-related protein [Muribaculaceae bacterium]|nr:CinA family nicotinamide mononucleotide deamidase-related protein [Muribaculaceae bacterium]